MSRVSLFSSPYLLGFEELERLLDRASKTAGDGYPPYNIERLGRVDGESERLRITLAVAGFGRDDLEVTLEPNGSTREVMIDRIVHLGFNVRLDLVGGEGERLSVQTTRDHAELHEFAAGQIVYVRPVRHTTFT